MGTRYRPRPALNLSIDASLTGPVPQALYTRAAPQYYSKYQQRQIIRIFALTIVPPTYEYSHITILTASFYRPCVLLRFSRSQRPAARGSL